MTPIEPGPRRRADMDSVPAQVGVPESLTSRGFQVRALGPLPDGFDPMTATARQLAVFRLPRRPDAAEEPELHELWTRTMAHTNRWVTPEFEHHEHISHGPPHPKRTRTADDGTRVDDAPFTNWSGAVDFAPPGMSYTFVGGQWTVPDPDVTEDGSYYASEWVGLDGCNSADVLQAGTETNILKLVFFRHTEVYAWWEWWPAGEVVISNLPVAAGDRMFCLICAGTSRSTVLFGNLSQRVGTRFEVTAPEGARLVGNAAEWIVERPAADGSQGRLCGDATAQFDECIAGDCTGVEDDLSR